MAALCALAPLVVACSGSAEQTEPRASVATTRVAAPETRPAPLVGSILLRFVRAAARGDADMLWRLLSTPTRDSLGPTLARFRPATAREFQQGLGSLAPSARVILARRVGERWAVAAVAGERTAEGRREPFTYGAALVREGDAWRLDLGGVVIGGLEPEPLATVGVPARVAVNVSAGAKVGEVVLWLDGRPLAVERRSDAPFSARVLARLRAPLAAGRHTVVAFATAGETPGAVAWTFAVRE